MAEKILLIICKVCHNSFTLCQESEFPAFLRHFRPVHDDRTEEEYYVCQNCGASVPMQED